jgi:hypothetical protein
MPDAPYSAARSRGDSFCVKAPLRGAFTQKESQKMTVFLGWVRRTYPGKTARRTCVTLTRIR